MLRQIANLLCSSTDASLAARARRPDPWWKGPGASAPLRWEQPRRKTLALQASQKRRPRSLARKFSLRERQLFQVTRHIRPHDYASGQVFWTSHVAVIQVTCGCDWNWMMHVMYIASVFPVVRSIQSMPETSDCVLVPTCIQGKRPAWIRCPAPSRFHPKRISQRNAAWSGLLQSRTLLLWRWGSWKRRMATWAERFEFDRDRRRGEGAAQAQGTAWSSGQWEFNHWPRD
jgi:hypothetical protein